MSIIRAPRPDVGYSILNNDTIRDQALSFRARGVLLYLLSMPDNWSTSSSRLQGAMTEGRDAIRRAIKELQEAGYMRLEKKQDEQGRWHSHWIVYDKSSKSAVQKLVDIRKMKPQPMPEKPTPVNQALKEELTTNDLVIDYSRYLGTPKKVCGQCQAAGVIVIDGDQIIPCPECKGDGIARG